MLREGCMQKKKRRINVFIYLLIYLCKGAITQYICLIGALVHTGRTGKEWLFPPPT